jgi:hypothetical protein
MRPQSWISAPCPCPNMTRRHRVPHLRGRVPEIAVDRLRPGAWRRCRAVLVLCYGNRAYEEYPDRTVDNRPLPGSAPWLPWPPGGTFYQPARCREGRPDGPTKPSCGISWPRSRPNWTPGTPPPPPLPATGLTKSACPQHRAQGGQGLHRLRPLCHRQPGVCIDAADPKSPTTAMHQLHRCIASALARPQPEPRAGGGLELP